MAQIEREKGQTALAVEYFQKAQALAAQTHDLKKQARALLIVSGLQIRLFQYRNALGSADSARQLALNINDNGLAGAAASNRATVYSQVGDNLLAAEAAADAVALLERSDRKDYLAMSLINFGDIQSESDNAKAAISAFHRAIALARSEGFHAKESFAQDHLGLTLLEANDLNGAATALEEARKLRTAAGDIDSLAITKQHLAKLAYRQGDYQKALTLLTDATASGTASYSTIPSYWTHQLRGEILLALGRRSEALTSFDKSVKSADAWRRNALPGDTTDTKTVATLHDIYQDYVELAAELSLEHHNPLLSRDALDVLAKSRAASLREQLLASLGQKMELPPRYLELLSQLKSAQASVTLGKNPKEQQAEAARLGKIRCELSDLENKIGIAQENSFSLSEKNPSRNSLRSIQLSLSRNQLLLSFSLGKRKSFLWAVTGSRLNLYELPSEDKIAAQAASFSMAVQKGSSGEAGRILSNQLFGKLDPVFANKPEWLIAADGALLDRVPFAALPLTAKACEISSLIAAHNLRFLPSELLLTDRRPAEPQPKFVGIADPIYNQADSRRHGAVSSAVHHPGSSVTLARLVGSDSEIRSSAKQSGMADTILLTGANASERNLRAALVSPPRVLHFALHVVSPERRQAADGAEAALALSLTKDGVPELLTKEAIAGLRVPGSLVILSGCSSQQGQNVPSAGVIGLGRAWLLAGAAAVIVSAWPTPDDSGQFFSAFYSHLQAKTPVSGNLAQRASAALQETQIDMQRSVGYPSSPSFWAAYSIISEE